MKITFTRTALIFSTIVLLLLVNSLLSGCGPRGGGGPTATGCAAACNALVWNGSPNTNWGNYQACVAACMRGTPVPPPPSGGVTGSGGAIPAPPVKQKYTNPIGNITKHKARSTLLSTILTEVTYDSLMSTLTSQTDSQIAATLSQTDMSCADIEDLLNGVSPAQKSTLEQTISPRLNSIFESMDSNNRLYYGTVYGQLLEDGVVEDPYTN